MTQHRNPEAAAAAKRKEKKLKYIEGEIWEIDEGGVKGLMKKREREREI